MLSQFQAILVGGLCPGTDDPAECEVNLPGFWAQIAALLWPGYWDPNVSWTIHSLASVRVFSTCLPNQAEWMCAPICAAPEDTNMTCDSCQMGIQVDQASEFHEPTISRLE